MTFIDWPVLGPFLGHRLITSVQEIFDFLGGMAAWRSAPWDDDQEKTVSP